MLNEEANLLIGAEPYERTDERAAYRAGQYELVLTTASDKVTLKTIRRQPCPMPGNAQCTRPTYRVMRRLHCQTS